MPLCNDSVEILEGLKLCARCTKSLPALDRILVLAALSVALGWVSWMEAATAVFMAQ